MNKTMKFRYLIAPLALAAVAFCGCQESAEYQPVIYMTDAQANPTNAIRVEATPASVDISVSASEAVGRETSIVLETRPDLLEAPTSGSLQRHVRQGLRRAAREQL